MAHHKSALKRIRQTKTRRLRNRYYGKTARTHIKDFRSTTDKKEATDLLPKTISEVDKLTKRGLIHKNKASNLKSSLMKKVNKM